MRRFLLAFVVSSFASLGVAVPACSSNGAASSPDSGGDGAIGPDQPVNAPCDPSLASPCLAGSPCYVVTCDPVAMVCLQSPVQGACSSEVDGSLFSFDGSVDVATVNAGCFTNADCSDDTVCGFSIIDACTATGRCVFPEPPTFADGGVYMGCGCDEEPVSYVTSTDTSAPVASGSPCVVSSDAGVDTGADATALDGAGGDDASDASDANVADSADSSADAGTDGS